MSQWKWPLRLASRLKCDKDFLQSFLVKMARELGIHTDPIDWRSQDSKLSLIYVCVTHFLTRSPRQIKRCSRKWWIQREMGGWKASWK